MESLPFGPPMWVRRGQPVRCYFEHPWGTHWEPEEHHGEPKGNTWVNIGTHGNMMRTQKIFNPSPYPSLPPQRKKEKTLLSLCSASHGLHANSNHRIDCHGFILLLEQMEKSIAKKKRKQ